MTEGQFVAKIGRRYEDRGPEYYYLSGELQGQRLVGSTRATAVRFHSAEEAQRQADATVAAIKADWDAYAGKTGRAMPGVLVGMWDYAEFPRKEG